MLQRAKTPYGVTNTHLAIVRADALASKAIVASTYLLAVDRFGATYRERKRLQAN